MKRLSLIVVLVTCCRLGAIAQGYPWEGSLREPMTIPRTYIGLEASASYAMYQANLSYIETSLGITCCTYDGGSGIPFAVSLVGERWATSHVKLSAGAGVSVVGASFTAPTEPVPLSNGQILRTEYVLNGSLTYATAFGAVSIRLGSTYVLATAGMRLHGYMRGALTQRERIVAPEGAMFNGQQPSTEVIISQSFLDNAAPLVVEPFLQLGYDLPIAYGIVLQPMVTFGLPLTSLTTVDDWRMRSLGLGLRLVKGL